MIRYGVRVTIVAAVLLTSIRRPLVQGALLSAAWRRRAVRQEHALLRCAGDVPLSYIARARKRRGDRCCAWLSAGESDSSRHVAHRPPPHHDGHGAPSADQSSTYHRGRRLWCLLLVEPSTRTVSPELCCIVGIYYYTFTRVYYYYYLYNIYWRVPLPSPILGLREWWHCVRPWPFWSLISYNLTRRMWFFYFLNNFCCWHDVVLIVQVLEKYYTPREEYIYIIFIQNIVAVTSAPPKYTMTGSTWETSSSLLTPSPSLTKRPVWTSLTARENEKTIVVDRVAAKFGTSQVTRWLLWKCHGLYWMAKKWWNGMMWVPVLECLHIIINNIYRYYICRYPYGIICMCIV